jgi:hypothetical protein
VVAAGLREEGDEGTRPGGWSRPTRQDGIEQGEKDWNKGIDERLIPFIRNAIRAGGSARR